MKILILLYLLFFGSGFLISLGLNSTGLTIYLFGVIPFALYCYYKWQKISAGRKYEEHKKQRGIEWERGREEREKREAEEKELEKLKYKERIVKEELEAIAKEQREHEERLENATRWMPPEKPVIPNQRRIRLKKTEPEKKLSSQQKKAISEYRLPDFDRWREQD